LVEVDVVVAFVVDRGGGFAKRGSGNLRGWMAATPMEAAETAPLLLRVPKYAKDHYRFSSLSPWAAAVAHGKRQWAAATRITLRANCNFS
jgi:hypothetical protein